MLVLLKPGTTKTIHYRNYYIISIEKYPSYCVFYSCKKNDGGVLCSVLYLIVVPIKKKHVLDYLESKFVCTDVKPPDASGQNAPLAAWV